MTGRPPRRVVAIKQEESKMKYLNNRGDRMRKLIILLVLTAFIVTLSSPIVYAAEWDPATGPNWVDRAYVERADVSGDDSGWGDVDSPIPNNIVIYSIFYANYNYNGLFIFLITPFILNENTQQTEHQEYDDTNNQHLTGYRGAS